MTVEGIEQLKRWLKWYAALAAVPFCFGLLTVWLPFFLSLLMLVGIAGLYLIGIAVTVRSSMAAWQTRPLGNSPMRRVGATLIPSLLLALAISAFFPLGQAGGRVGHIAQIAIYHERFEEIIAKEKVAPSADGRGEFKGVSYWTDPGPPVRVAFFPEGLLDNWTALIYDPTGEMMQADGFDPITGKFRAPDRVTRLFGGDLVWCRPVWGDYYECGFT